MNQPMTYRCTKTVIDDKDDEVCFTEGRLYRGEVSATPAGEWAIAFTDDTGTQHTASAAWLHQHFIPEQDRAALANFVDERIDENRLSWYNPWDGDFNLGDGDELARLAADLLGNRWTEAVEVALSLHGPEMKTTPPKIRVEAQAKWEDMGKGWQYDEFLSLPEGWTYEQVSKILWDGYTVYFEPINKPDEPDEDEED